MKRRAPRFPIAFTLLEVVLAMVLIAGLLVSCMSAMSHYQTALTRAQWQTRADAIGDQLMSAWHASDDGLPMVTRGLVPADPEFWFRTRIIETRWLCTVPVAVLRLEIIHQSELARHAIDSPDAAIMSGITYVRPIPTSSANTIR